MPPLRGACRFWLSSPRARAGGSTSRGAWPIHSDEESEVYAALTPGLRDYVEKNGFERVVLALSGGIDSALVALIAVDALGPSGSASSSCPPPLQRRDAGRCADDRREPRGRADRDLHRRGDGRLPARAGLQLRWRRARPGRGEPAGADSRQPGDGAVEQVRLARPHHGQQERDVCRLRDALRRHGRRLRRHQGRLQARWSTGSSAGGTSRKGAS